MLKVKVADLCAVVLAAMGAFGLNGCDGSLTVRGRIIRDVALNRPSCELTLWQRGGPLWEPPKPRKVQSAAVEDSFVVHWTVGGPKGERWLEVKCLGYETFRSKTFQSPTAVTDQNLGDMRLVPEPGH
jgi:hypothetical protein